MKKIISLSTKNCTLLKIEDAVNVFINSRKSNNCRDETIVYYKENLKLLSRYLEKNNIKLGEVTRTVIDDFKREQLKSVSASTVNIRLRAIKAFLNYLYDEDLIRKVKIEMLRTDKKKVKPFAEEHLKLIVQKPKRNSFAALRDWAMVNCFLDNGCRRSTLIKIKNKDANLLVKYMKLNTKNRNIIEVPISNTFAKILKEYMSIRGGEPEDYLFCNQFGGQLAKETIRDRIRIHCEKALGEVNVRYSPHTFRHTFAIQYLRNGGGIERLREIMDHSTIEVTKSYLNFTKDEVRKEYYECNPLDNIKRSGIKIK